MLWEYQRYLCNAQRDWHESCISEKESAKEGLNYSNSYNYLNDVESIKDYKRRLLELSEQRIEAQKYDDREELEKIEKEREEIEKCLSCQFPSSPESERLRKSIRNAIQRALENMKEYHPLLAKHLGNAIQKGRKCSYQPDKEIFWDIQY